MGRATDPGENHDPGKDQRFTPNLTQAPRLENSLGRFDSSTHRQPKSNGMAEAFVKTFKRDYVRVSPIPEPPQPCSRL